MRWLAQLVQDLGYAGRSFRRSPGFTLVALLSLTLGIGATTAIFSVIYGVLIAPVSVREAGRDLGARGPGGRQPRRAHLQPRRGREMAALPAFSDGDGDLDRDGAADRRVRPRASAASCSPANAFNFLGVPPVIGRTLQPSDIARGRHGGAGRRPQPRALAAAVPRQPRRPRQDAPSERSAAHHRRRDAAAVRVVWERRLLAAAVADARGPAVDQPDRPARAGRVEAGRRGTAARVAPAARAGEAGTPSRQQGFTTPARATTSTSPSRAARCGPACSCCSARSRSCC